MPNCVCFNLRCAARAMTQFYDTEMRRHGIRPTQGSILAALSAKESWSMAELSEGLGVERTTLLRNLRPLQRDGLVQAGGGGRGRMVEFAITAKVANRSRNSLQPGNPPKAPRSKTLGEKRWSAILTDLETAAAALKRKFQQTLNTINLSHNCVYAH